MNLNFPNASHFIIQELLKYYLQEDSYYDIFDINNIFDGVTRDAHIKCV